MDDYKIGLIQMMENAGRNLAHLARERFLGGDPRKKNVIVLAGTGGNGGGALVCARRLHNYGANVAIFLIKPDEAFTPIPAHQLRLVRYMGLAVEQADTVNDNVANRAETPDLIIDGIIGYSLKGTLRGAANDLVRWANDQQAPTLSMDVPSGIDTTTGTIFEPAIRAAATMTLALPKEGLRAPGVDEYLGELYLADIGVPPELYAQPGLGLQVPHIFAKNDIVRLT